MSYPNCYHCSQPIDQDGFCFDDVTALRWICPECNEIQGAVGAHALYVAESVKRGVRRPMQWNALGRATQSRWLRTFEAGKGGP